MKKIVATIALFLVGSLWGTVGRESGYTLIGLLFFAFSVSLIVSLWRGQATPTTKKIVVGYLILSVIAIILLPIINPPMNK